MAILATKDESSTRTILEIEVPAEEVEKAFAAVTKAYAKKASIPGFRKGHAPQAVVYQRFGDQIKEDVLEALLPDALASAVEERKLAVLGRPHIEDLQWEPPGPLRFSARLDLKPPVDPGEYRGLPVEDQPVEPADEDVASVLERIREAHAEFHPVEGRPASPGDFAVADIGGSFVEILAPGQNPRTFRDEKLTLEVGHADSMPEINEALRGALPGDTRKFRKIFPRRLSQRGVPREDGRLRGHPRGAQGEEAAGRGRRLRPRRLGGGHARDAAGKGPNASASRKGSRPPPPVPPVDPRLPALPPRHPGAGGPRRVGERPPPSATTPAISRRAASTPRRRTGPSSRRRHGRGPSAGSRSTCSSTRSPSARGSRSRKPSSRRSSSAPRRSAESSPPSCGNRWQKAEGSRPFGTRCAWPGPWTS